MSPLLSLSSVLLEPPNCVVFEVGSISGLALSEKGKEQGQHTAGLFGDRCGEIVSLPTTHTGSPFLLVGLSTS